MKYLAFISFRQMCVISTFKYRYVRYTFQAYKKIVFHDRDRNKKINTSKLSIFSLPVGEKSGILTQANHWERESPFFSRYKSTIASKISRIWRVLLIYNYSKINLNL